MAHVWSVGIARRLMCDVNQIVDAIAARLRLAPVPSLDLDPAAAATVILDCAGRAWNGVTQRQISGLSIPGCAGRAWSGVAQKLGGGAGGGECGQHGGGTGMKREIVDRAHGVLL